MAITREKIAVGAEIEPLQKEILLEDLDRKGGGGTHAQGFGFHNSAKAAMEIMAMPRVIGNGSRMSAYNAEAAARFLGQENFNSSGIVDMHYNHPWFSGETMTITGRVSDIRPEGDGQRVTIDMRFVNSEGARCGLGVASAVVPSDWVR